MCTEHAMHEAMRARDCQMHLSHVSHSDLLTPPVLHCSFPLPAFYNTHQRCLNEKVTLRIVILSQPADDI